MKKAIIIMTLAAALSLASCGAAENTESKTNSTAQPAAASSAAPEADEETVSEPTSDSTSSDESTDESSESAAESASDSSKAEEKTASAADKSSSSSAAEKSGTSSEETASKDSTDSAQKPAQDSSSTAAADPDVAREVYDAVIQFNAAEEISAGHLASTEVMFDENFAVTEDASAAKYYRVTHENVDSCTNFTMSIYQGHFTKKFVTAMGYDTVASEKFIWYNDELYFRTDCYNEVYNIYNPIGDDIYMTDDKSCYLLARKLDSNGSDLGVYKLSFVNETIITADTFIWKIDSVELA